MLTCTLLLKSLEVQLLSNELICHTSY